MSIFIWIHTGSGALLIKLDLEWVGLGEDIPPNDEAKLIHVLHERTRLPVVPVEWLVLGESARRSRDDSTGRPPFF